MFYHHPCTLVAVDPLGVEHRFHTTIDRGPAPIVMFDRWGSAQPGLDPNHHYTISGVFADFRDDPDFDVASYGACWSVATVVDGYLPLLEHDLHA